VPQIAQIAAETYQKLRFALFATSAFADRLM
jgi:hypothetical protein